MATQDVMPISAATGMYLALESVAGAKSDGGNVGPDTGKNMPAEEATKPNLAQLARQLNLASRSIGRDLRFRVDMESGQSVIQVLDRETGELIREIPPDQTTMYLSASGLVELRLYDGLA